MITGKSLTELAAEIERQNSAMHDLIVPSQKMEMVAYDGQTPALKIENQPDLYPVTEIGHETLTARLGIPSRYYDRMRNDAPALLAYNVNTWLKQEGEAGTSRMVRTLDGNARAVLSDKYKRLDNYEFLMTVLPVLMESSKADGHDIEIQSTEITDRRMYLQLTFAGLETEFAVNKGGREVGEVVKAGLIMRNSEVGYGCREIQFLAYTLACTNGMVLPREIGSFATRHIGGRKGNGDIFALSRETQEADARAFALATRDAVKQMVSRDNLQALVDRMRAANGRPITGAPDAAVRELGKSFSLTEDEQAAVMRHLINDGDLSHYGLTNAITRAAQDATSYDRAVELEEVGGVFLHMPERQLVPILAATGQDRKAA